GVPSFLGGASVFTGDSGQGAIAAGARVTLWDAHLQYQWRGLELRGLWSQATVNDAAAVPAAKGIPPGSADSVGSRLRGWYAQAAWDLFTLRREAKTSLTPFVRLESLDTQKGVPSGFGRNPANDRRIMTVGLSWKPI